MSVREVADYVRDLDLITFIFFYHDTTYMLVDRAKMNAKLFAALKLGGFLVIADHSAAARCGCQGGKVVPLWAAEFLETLYPTAWGRRMGRDVGASHAIASPDCLSPRKDCHVEGK
jgi:hypothetical protein